MKITGDNQSIQKKSDQLVRHYQIPVNLKKDQVLDTILRKIEDKEAIKKKRTIMSPALITGLVAASVVIVLVIQILTAKITYTGNSDDNLAFRLPDQSRVVIKDNGSIQFNKYFWNRKVTLAGAAYFEVEKGTKFNVATNFGTVEVLGTRFLVVDKNDSLQVQCFEGKVNTITNANSFVLDPGTQYVGTNLTGKKEIIKGQKEYPEFARFNRNFPNVSLNKVMQEMGDFFGIDIDIQDVGERKFSGTIDTGKPETALEIVCQSMQLKYRFTNKYRVQIFN